MTPTLTFHALPRITSPDPIERCLRDAEQRLRILERTGRRPSIIRAQAQAIAELHKARLS